MVAAHRNEIRTEPMVFWPTSMGPRLVGSRMIAHAQRRSGRTTVGAGQPSRRAQIGARCAAR
jgi:hypothetical protein